MLGLLTSQSFQLDLVGLMLAVTFPLGTYLLRSYRTKSEMESQFANYILSTARAVRGGATLPKAFMIASDGSYGKLKPTIARFVSRVRLGIPLKQALDTFKEIKSSSVLYMTSSISSLMDLTTNMDAFLEELAQFQMTYLNMRRKRENETRIHVIIMYTAFLTFLLAMGATIEIVPATSGSIPLFSARSALNPSLFKGMIFYVALTETIFLGLLAGVVNKGNVASGVIHVAVMLALLMMFSFTVLWRARKSRLASRVSRSQPMAVPTRRYREDLLFGKRTTY